MAVYSKLALYISGGEEAIDFQSYRPATWNDNYSGLVGALIINESRILTKYNSWIASIVAPLSVPLG
jgi:hypothetical protein